MQFLPWHLASAYGLDLLVGDPRWLPHPVRWMGRLIAWVERVYYDEKASAAQQRLGGCAFWATVVGGVTIGAIFLLELSFFLDPVFGTLVMIWLSYTTMATRSLHIESARVVYALKAKDLPLARRRLSMIVSRDTADLDERGILRAVIETVSENLSDGIVAPLFFLGLGGPIGGIVYKAVSTMDSMVGYVNERYRFFGWCAARMDDLVNWIPARLSALMLVGAAYLVKCDWREAWNVMRRDARLTKSPNAGYPEAAMAGALGIQLGGTGTYFGKSVVKPTLGDPRSPITVETYPAAIRLMYVSSLIALSFSLGLSTLVTALF